VNTTPGATPTRQFLSFAAVGVVGFVVDASALYFAMHVLGAGLYGGRLLSYLAAATTTWALNRSYTFRTQRSHNKFAEWGRFLGANAVGGLVNYATYAILVTWVPMAAAHPVLGVAAGSIAGLTVNFLLSRRVVFKGTASGR
jgi:putative flippase GtrA